MSAGRIVFSGWHFHFLGFTIIRKRDIQLEHRESVSENMQAFHAIVKGEVQGVGFRMSAIIRAEQLGLTGWVRNTPDGDVEVWAEGNTQALEHFYAWLQVGPSAARVDEVIKTDEQPRGVYKRFSVAF